ncbi:MAG: glycosyltransferase [Desulfuromusa sp.]
MKVCHFIASTGLGRGEAYIDLVNALCERIEIVLLVPQGALFIPRVDKRIHIVEYRSKGSRRNPFLYLELYLKFRKINPDMVHTHFAKATETFYKLNKILKMPWVSTKHNPRKGRIFNKLDQVIAVSSGVADSINHNRVTIIHNGISPEVFPPATEENKLFTIIAVGRLEKVKAFDQLIAECAQLTFDFTLLIVGDGPEKNNLVNLAISLNIDKKINFLGYRTDIPRLMHQADVVVVCSHNEGFGLVVLEALFYGRVLISRDVGISGDILSERFLIKEFQIASRLEDVYRNTESFKREFVDIKKLHGHQYLIDNSSQEHLIFYQKLLLSG